MEQESRGSMSMRGRSEQCSTGKRLSLSSKLLSHTLQDRIARTGDVVIAVALLALTLPLFVLLCLAIKLDSPGPVLYRQHRLGPDGGWVSVLNFRITTHDVERVGRIRYCAAPETRVGRLLHYTRMNELPQLIDVLRGEMALIGAGVKFWL